MFHGDEFRDQVDHWLGVDSGEGDASGRFVQSCHVLVRTEEANLPVGVFVGFHAFEAFESVVEDAGGGVEAEILVGCYAGSEPALGSRPFY